MKRQVFMVAALIAFSANSFAATEARPEAKSKAVREQELKREKTREEMSGGKTGSEKIGKAGKDMGIDSAVAEFKKNLDELVKKAGNDEAQKLWVDDVMSGIVSAYGELKSSGPRDEKVKALLNVIRQVRSADSLQKAQDLLVDFAEKNGLDIEALKRDCKA